MILDDLVSRGQPHSRSLPKFLGCKIGSKMREIVSAPMPLLVSITVSFK